MTSPSESPLLLQACAVPYRSGKSQWEFCLVTSVRKGRWGFPKGIIDPGETPAQTALKEAFEEAGLRGSISGRPLGKYHYQKWERTLQVTVYLMQVEVVEDEWEEAHLRDRCWANADEAVKLIGNPSQQKLLLRAIARLNGAGQA
jgi:8-oxo-dGTP pyrophosphatase MutT (NUDIX family)